MSCQVLAGHTWKKAGLGSSQIGEQGSWAVVGHPLYIICPSLQVSVLPLPAPSGTISLALVPLTTLLTSHGLNVALTHPDGLDPSELISPAMTEQTEGAPLLSQADAPIPGHGPLLQGQLSGK